MKLKLYESGIRNMRQIAKEYNKAWIYMHIDLDGITSAIAMKEYLKQYGIATTNCVPMQYGEMEYSIEKTPNDTIPVLVDFAHGKVFMKIHTDHHDKQIYYGRTSIAFSKDPSNAGTISTKISAKDIFSKEDVRVIDMIDSAGYADEDISIDELKNYLFNYNKERTSIQNHLRFGMVVGKLLLAYKNKPGYLKQVAMESKPSLMSMFQVMRKIVKENGWADMKQLQKNSDWYAKSQEENKIPEGDIDTINNLSNGQNTLVGNTIVQVGGGNTRKSGAYDRYTAFKLYPKAKYFVMIWDTIGMMQVAKNNWNKENRTTDSHDYINLGELVISDVFNKKYSKLLNKKIYDISLLAIKKTLESKIEKENIPEAIGFDYDELIALFGDLPNATDKQKDFIKKAMKLKPQELMPNENDSEKRKQFKEKVIKFLNDFTIPLPEIIMKTSGGHPGITNLNGFQFLQTQRRIFGALKGGRNPYAPLDPNWKPDPNKPKKENVVLELLKAIACDVVKILNQDEQIINYWKTHKGEDPVYKTLYEAVEDEPYPVGYQFSTKYGGDMRVTHIDWLGDNKLYRVQDLEPTELWICQGDSPDSPSKKITDYHTFSVSKEWIDYNKEEELKSPEDEGEWLEESKQLNENYEQWNGTDTDIIGVGETNNYIYRGYKIYTTASYDEYDENGDDLVVYYASISSPDDNMVKMFSDEIWKDLCHDVTKYIDDILEDEAPNEKAPKDKGDKWLEETKASRFNKHLDDTEKSFATVSAERSMPQISNREKQRALNHRRTKVLEKLLKAWGLKGYIKTKGGFDEAGQPRVEINGNLSEEDSFFVPNITKEQAIRLGKLFNQDSVMFKEKGSNEVKELRTNTKAGDEGIGSETGLVFIVGQGRFNIGRDKTYYSRPKSSMIKFAFNPEDESK